MAQQPNVELSESKYPRPVAEPGPAVRWRADKPGVPTSPADVDKGGSFGSAGPDPGWGLKIVASADLPDDDPRLRDVVCGLVLARAAALGRAPVPVDIEAALVLCGYYDDAPKAVVEQRKRWLDAVPHDQRPGQTAAAEVDRDLIVYSPEQIRYALRAGERA